MPFEHKDGSGSLFRNTYKKQPNHPDHTGEIMIDGKLYRLAAWIKEGNNGKFFSISAQLKDQQPQRSESAPAPDDDFDDDIPF